MEKIGKLFDSYALKGVMIAILTLCLLIPSFMVQELINERQLRMEEAVKKIDSKWSYAQTISGPILTMPFTQSVISQNNLLNILNREISITPEILNVDVELLPEERHYGIYKTILYKSVVKISGMFKNIDEQSVENSVMEFGKAYLKLGLSDMRGISDNIVFKMNDQQLSVKSGGYRDHLMDEILIVDLGGMDLKGEMSFDCKIELKGSKSINFIPLGGTTMVKVAGKWSDPGFTGNYTPEYRVDKDGFEAKWQVLKFNRNIPDTWIDNDVRSGEELAFGVSLIDTVNVYQQSMRSAKYSFMFIALTFVLFFFTEIFTKNRIHVVHYLLVGVGLILFYSLLLSLSEQLGFALAYLISGCAIVALIATYGASVFRNKRASVTLTLLLILLYTFLYFILQLEEMALLVGNVGLLVILGVIMYFSRKINWFSDRREKE